MKRITAVMLIVPVLIGLFTGCIKDMIGVFETTEFVVRTERQIETEPVTEDVTEAPTEPATENTAQAAVELAPREVARLCTPAVFYVEVYDRDEYAFGTGSGFFLTEDGVAVTNYHVIEGAHSAYIKTTSDEIYNILGYYYLNAEADIAVLKVGAPAGVRFPALKIGSIEAIEQGERIYAIGSPFGLDNTFTEGLISNTFRTMDKAYIQHSAPISAGNSGGPLINSFGEVIGVNTSVYEQSGNRIGQNLNFAVPVTTIDIDSFRLNLPQPFTNAPWITYGYSQSADADFGDDYDYTAEWNLTYMWLPNVPDFGLLAGINAGSGEDWIDEDGDSVFTYRYDPDWLEIPLETVVAWRELYDKALVIYNWEKYSEYENEEEPDYGMAAWFRHPTGNVLCYRWYSHTIWIDIYYDYTDAAYEGGYFATEDTAYERLPSVPDFGKLAGIAADGEEDWIDENGDNVYTYIYNPDWIEAPYDIFNSWRKLYEMALAAYQWEKLDEWEITEAPAGTDSWFGTQYGSVMRLRWYRGVIFVDVFYYYGSVG